MSSAGVHHARAVQRLGELRLILDEPRAADDVLHLPRRLAALAPVAGPQDGCPATDLHIQVDV